MRRHKERRRRRRTGAELHSDDDDDDDDETQFNVGNNEERGVDGRTVTVRYGLLQLHSEHEDVFTRRARG